VEDSNALQLQTVGYASPSLEASTRLKLKTRLVTFRCADMRGCARLQPESSPCCHRRIDEIIFAVQKMTLDVREHRP
jgi:hypothetical protein